jgi:hypothetical protein
VITWEERVERVTRQGFTERQAEFLVTVMLHAGVWVPRQYCAFAGIRYGQVVSDFYHGLVARRIATGRVWGHRRWRLMHVRHKGLYHAIEEPNNRHRRPMTLARALERLMVLDGVLADRETRWLATEQEKVAHFTLRHRIQCRDLPALTFRAEDAETVRHFPDKLPIGVHPDHRRYVFLYAVVRDAPVDFRAFLERHADLWRRLPSWTLRLLVPRHHRTAISRYETAFRDQLASPLQRRIVDEARWYFRARRERPDASEDRFDQDAEAFATPRFTALYRAWLERGDSVFDAAQSATLADAIAGGTGRLESYVLPHQYAHFVRLVGTA